jgi:hypothetical protein
LVTYNHPPLRISADGTLAINGTDPVTEAREFYATEKVVAAAQRALARAGSRVELTKDPDVTITVDQGTLYKVGADFKKVGADFEATPREPVSTSQKSSSATSPAERCSGPTVTPRLRRSRHWQGRYRASIALPRMSPPSPPTTNPSPTSDRHGLRACLETRG